MRSVAVTRVSVVLLAALATLAPSPARADDGPTYVGRDAIPVGTAYRRIPVPPSGDEAVSALFMDRALTFYAAQEEHRRVLSGRLSFVNAGVFTTVGSVMIARGSSTPERVTGGAWTAFGVASFVDSLLELGSTSELERLRFDYASWRRDERIPAWQATHRALVRWREIAHRRRSVRTVLGWAELTAGTLLGASAIVEVSTAKETITRYGAVSTAMASLMLVGTSASTLTSQSPAEEGYRAWLVYVRPLPADEATNRATSWTGATVGVTGRF